MNGINPLHAAVLEGDLGRVKALLKGHPNLVFSKDPLGMTPYEDVEELLPAKGSDVNGATALHYAAYKDRNDVVQLLLAAGANVNAKDRFSCTPLHYAVRWGRNKAVAESLLGRKAKVNTKDICGETPLHWVAVFWHKDVAELLLANKADVNAKTKNGDTPLHLAAAGKR